MLLYKIMHFYICNLYKYLKVIWRNKYYLLFLKFKEEEAFIL